MDLQQLRAFTAVAEHLHFGRAAQSLHLAQPHLTRIVRALEADLGVRLFERSTRRVEITPAGAALVERARAMLELEAEARASVVAADRGQIGRVRMVFAGPSAQQAVGELARTVREQHPGIDLELQPGRYGEVAVSDLLHNQTDLALARFPRPPAGVSSRAVSRDRCVVAIPAGHPLADAERIRFADFRGEPFIAFPESFGSAIRDILVERCQAAGFAVRFVQTSPDTWTSITLVSAGVGLHFTMAGALTHLPLDGVRVRELAEPAPPLIVYLIWRSDDRSPALRTVLRTAEDLLPTVD
ncbi:MULTISPECIES: LysR family transcriptional regulator [Amycolatopsis]|uniref:LysR family transcriptional regulator n=1 Tax=Amycolatopsis echigonensis TaxID=2576905 RepID=A0A8E1VUB3_9PSEU|nr:MULTISPECIES: LysR family transcriptional regulator [Amycolatopsis]MBB2498442.1 LysR family transcriptional regulator [Amycolatopsis echigonensis]